MYANLSESTPQISSFFKSIDEWRSAYTYATFCYLGVRNSQNKLLIISARIILSGTKHAELKPRFKVDNIEAGQWRIDQGIQTIEKMLEALSSPEGFSIDEIGPICISNNDIESLYVGDPILLHPEGLASGNRLSVLTIYGDKLNSWIPQPDTDWLLKSADTPYDSLNEVKLEYGLGGQKEHRSIVEIIAGTTIEIFQGSEIKKGVATLGVWLVKSLNKHEAKIGYRVLDKGQVITRSSIHGSHLDWTEDDRAYIGTKSIEVPPGAIVQCIASYRNKAHHILWRADPVIFQNSRAAALSLVDPNQTTLKGCLFPDPPAKGKAADDFEIGISWLLWVLGFSPVIFGTHPKTKDGLDIVSTTPKGDFVVVECTLGLLRAESKLSKLGARVIQLRNSLDASNLKQTQILPIIATALPREQIEVDINSAEENGILVLAKQDIESLFNILLWLPNPENLFEKGIAKVAENKLSKKSVNGGIF